MLPGPRTLEDPILTIAYIVVSLVGCAYIVFSAFSGHAGDAGGHAPSHHDGHVPDAHYGIDGHGHGPGGGGPTTP